MNVAGRGASPNAHSAAGPKALMAAIALTMSSPAQATAAKLTEDQPRMRPANIGRRAVTIAASPTRNNPAASRR
ncbi:MAG: hypothetical protein GWO16_14865 [Gammaproteobacteria bacterium]|nr:hypothetical protein [Gammaproteobacteria bacterium]